MLVFLMMEFPGPVHQHCYRRRGFVGAVVERRCGEAVLGDYASGVQVPVGF